MFHNNTLGFPEVSGQEVLNLIGDWWMEKKTDVLIKMGLGKLLNSLNTKINIAQQLNED